MPTIKTLNAKVKRRNRQFQKASASDKRIMIARDVIERVHTKQFIAKTRIWWSKLTPWKNVTEEQQLQTALVQGARCTCCGIGALFLSLAAIKDEITVCEAIDCADSFTEMTSDLLSETTGIFSPGLRSYFSKAQLELIEAAFEGREVGTRTGRSMPGANDFYLKYPNEESLLLAIMRNIVKNKGTFRP